MTSDDTVFSSLLSGVHGRERRLERNIEKIDLLRAKKYGMEEKSRYGRIKYTYGGIVFIYDPVEGKEITTFPSNDGASDKTGTKCIKPIILPKNKAYENAKHIQRHEMVKSIIRNDKTKWKSHSVFVVDMSGSMRRDDVSGAKCRSDGVWMVLARDFVKKQLEDNAASEFDVVSVILMKETAELVLKCEPTDWILYNALIDVREWSTCRPSGHGYYLPALDMAEKVLAINNLGTCALSLVFFSDGKPSDQGPFAEKMGEIASRYRRRLTFSCIGMAEGTDEEAFRALNDMVTEAEAFGAKSSFTLPSLDTESLSHIISSMASSLTATKTEMTDLATGETRVVRLDVRSERQGTADDLHPTDTWRVYNKASLFVVRIWSWSSEKDSFVRIRDPRCTLCSRDCIQQARIHGKWCPNCKVIAICEECAKTKGAPHVGSKVCQLWLKAYQIGKVVARDVPSFTVAVKKLIFGEGAERVVRKFRYLDQNGNFFGPKMVAKESRFIDPVQGSYKEKKAFHESFMRTQALASKFASMFNEALDSLHVHFRVRDIEFLKKLPRIEFVEPMVVEVRENQEESNILIERFIEGKYEKFNNNMGFVKGQKQQDSSQGKVDQLAETFNNFGLDDLGVIEEGSEDESDDELIDHKVTQPDSGEYHDIQDDMFPQAFSHYSFEKSKMSLMVVDLQGVFQKKSDGTRKYVLTDPAIHKKGKLKRHRLEFGRTNKGTAGMKAFFDTHECTDACRLLGLRKVNPKRFM